MSSYRSARCSMAKRRRSITRCAGITTNQAAIIALLRVIHPTAKEQASTILAALHEAEAELVGKAVILTDGIAGTVEHVWLDDLHGLRISVRGHGGKWPVSTIMLAQKEITAF